MALLLLLLLRLRLLLAVVLQTLGDAMSRQMADGLTTPRRPRLSVYPSLSPPCPPTTPATSLLRPWLSVGTTYGEEGTASCIAVRAAVHRHGTSRDPVQHQATAMQMVTDKAMVMAMAMAMALEMPVAHSQCTTCLEPVLSGSPPC
ncbi:hypothetical protein COCMIDRAFT_38260 [Bipolaris oryzae ATCC 44560]|uniref:Secreted protein n=1 Tax=Bipolaris oryzae ATCC 44560 TaxID=930090 RepID=W6Z292_COCMI|nr:uncharacterized protein COCMIDRAFT_38260 [Bipolaris oryzae ATCC 44560]EUC43823.1 hypothetical protein COCMIDRAFT_38260 [Bipolaris oryzae ATCC 44560]